MAVIVLHPTALRDDNTARPPKPPDDMEARIAKLEAATQQMQIDVAVIRANYATKEDLHKAINDQTWKLITWTTGLGAALMAAAFFVARNVH